jgi:hypothetical protein
MKSGQHTNQECRIRIWQKACIYIPGPSMAILNKTALRQTMTKMIQTIELPADMND